MKYKLCLDLGSTSLGWAVLGLDGNNQPSSLIDMGVRIYDDGRDAKTFEPIAVSRRLARGARRNRDRRNSRKENLLKALLDYGLFPKEEDSQKELEKQDPYILRTEALDKKITLHQLGRALFHINQRRGFQSNRKSDKKSNEAGPVKKSIAKLEQEMMATGVRTLGEYLGKLETKRVRRYDKEYTLYPIRKMYADEVDALFKKQKEFYPDILTEEVCQDLKNIIFFQRPLHKPKIGLCTFEYNAENEKERERAPLALPSVQNFRIWQEVNNLDLEQYTPTDPRLDKDDRTQIANLLNKSNKSSFKKIRKTIDLDDGAKFNLEYDARTELKGNETSTKLSHKEAFGKKWHNFTLEQQDEIVLTLLEEENESTLKQWLISNYKITEEQANYIADITLPDGYGRVSQKAINKILPFLKEGYGYSDACQKAGYHHSDFRTGEIIEPLCYYGEALPHRVIGGSNVDQDKSAPEKFYGKVNNPTVHIVLNQLRKLVNACTEKWGAPEQIALELARDLKQPKGDILKDQAKNRKDNERIAKELTKLDVKNNYANRMKYKLWEDLGREPQSRCCPFTGVTIGVNDIFSSQFEVEHLIPFSLSFDDSRANKVLSSRAANRDKGNKTPYEAFSHNPHHYNWHEIQARADQLNKSRRWRFQPDALDKVKDDNNGGIARQLNDTRYLSRLAKEYLQFVCGPNNVTTVPGQMTAFMRHQWALDSDLFWDEGMKDRSDHRHHAIDAFVVGCTTRAMLQKISGAAKNMEGNKALQEKRHKLVEGMPEPYENFLKEVQDKFHSMVISHKPDHGNAAKAINAPAPYTTAQLHQESAYGYVGKGNKKDTSFYVIRKPIESMEKTKDLEAIRDDKIRHYLLSAVESKKDKSKEFTEALYNAAENWSTPIRRTRVLVQKSNDVMIGINDKQTQTPHKFYQGGGNAYTEIYMATHGDKAGQWKAETISQYDAHNPENGRKWRKADPTAKLVMKLHNNDMVAYEENGKTVIARVKKMTGGRVYARDHKIAQEDGDKESWAASANQMQQKNFRKISVDILGRVQDPKRPKLSLLKEVS